MLARRLPGLLAPPDEAEAIEVTRIHSIAGLLQHHAGLISSPPFRSPHHSATLAALVGGGPGPRPGEVSLAHRGVLLLDELPEFARHALEGLRQPLEDGTVTVSRAAAHATFPARVLLIATMNLCPCGARGDTRLECSCTPAAISGYANRVSRALLDRFDLVVTMPRGSGAELAAPAGESTAAVALRVAGAQPILQASCEQVSGAAAAMLDQAVDRLPLSARGRARTLRVAATAAALAGVDVVAPEHVAEALSYRAPADFNAA